MSKQIKITEDVLNEIRRDFEEALSSGKFSDGKVTFTKTLGEIDRKATVFFTEIAWLKMQTLIREFDKEVAWHGIAKRGTDDSKDEYYIEDILVYPQEVTGATVTTDQEKYQTWLMDHDDEVFNNIRMQGHSHVNMGVTPSSVDTSLYERILDQLEDDMFYIFMIWNKRGDKTVKIYDLLKNVMFDTRDITVEVMDDGSGIEGFIKQAKELVKNKSIVSTYTSVTNIKHDSRTEDKNSDDKKDDKKEKSSKSSQKKGKRKEYQYSSYWDDWYDRDYGYSGYAGYDPDKARDPFYSAGN